MRARLPPGSVPRDALRNYPDDRRAGVSWDDVTSSTQELKNRDMERESKKAINLELHTVTIAEYLRVQRIPRGLRVPLQPTFFQDDKEYCFKFEHILSKCSFDLMSLTLAYLQKNLDTVNTQISAIKNQLSSTLPQEDFQEIKSKNQETLRIHRQELEKKKRSKFLRDTEDYLQNRVYQWWDKQRFSRRRTSQNSSGSTDSRAGTISVSASAPFLGNNRGRGKGRRGGGANATGDSRTQVTTRSQRFYCNLRLKAHFQGIPSITSSQDTPALLQLKDLGLRTPSSFIPPRDKPPHETFITLVERDMETFNREVNLGRFHYKTNLTAEEKLALDQLSTDKFLVIKPVDKGRAIVIMDKTDYMSEIQRQLSDTRSMRLFHIIPLVTQLVKS
ncbi:unnamed protein product, partial [Ranitomeya imitator]